MVSSIVNKYPWRAVALAFFVGVMAGGAGTVWLWPSGDGSRVAVAEPVPLHAALEGKKEIVYVPKEAREQADVQINTASPQVTVKVNGQETRFAALTEEKQKFEKGKLVITEETQLKLEIKTPPQPRLSLGVGWGKRGAAVMAAGRPGGGPIGWWLYGDRRTVAGGVLVPVGR